MELRKEKPTKKVVTDFSYCGRRRWVKQNDLLHGLSRVYNFISVRVYNDYNTMVLWPESKQMPLNSSKTDGAGDLRIMVASYSALVPLVH